MAGTQEWMLQLLGYHLSSGQWLKYLFWLGVCLTIAALLYGTDKRKKISAGALGFAVMISGALVIQDPGYLQGNGVEYPPE